MAFPKFLTPDLIKTFRRFPVSICCSVLFFLMVLSGQADDAGTVVILGPAIVSFVIARLAAEAYGLKAGMEALIGVVGALPYFVILLTDPPAISHIVLSAIYALLIFSVPFAFRRSDDLSYWAYQNQICSAVMIGVAASLLFMAGSAIALFSIDYLFGSKLASAIKYVSLFVSIVYGPFVTLSWFPEKFEAEPAECKASPGLPFILNWILAPLAVIYFLILYVYGFKILLTWDLPRGNVAYMVMGFGCLGILIYISGWIMRESGNALVRFLYQHFFKLLILPVVLLLIGITTRIGDYGVTIDRYYVALIAVWLGIMAVTYTLRPHAPVKIILSVLTCMLVLSLFGPWGAVSLSERSQYGRLVAVLEKNGMIRDGVAAPPEKPLSLSDRKELSSIVDYLLESKSKKLLTLFPNEGGRGNYTTQGAAVLATIDVTYLNEYERKRSQSEMEAAEAFTWLSFAVPNNERGMYDIKGFSSIVTDLSAQEIREGKTPEKPDTGYVLVLADNKLTLLDERREIVLAGPEKLLQLAKMAQDKSQTPFVLNAKQGNFRVRYVVQNASIHDYGEGRMKVNSVSGYMLVSE